MNNKTENILDKKRIFLKKLQDKWELAGKPKYISIQLKEFEFSGINSPDDIIQIFKALDTKEKIIKTNAILIKNIQLYKNLPILGLYLYLYIEGYLTPHHFWNGLYIYNSEDKISLELNEKKLKHAIKKYGIDKFQFSTKGEEERERKKIQRVEERPFFDTKCAILKWGKKERKFQIGKASHQILTELWNSRRINISGEIKQEGEYKTLAELWSKGFGRNIREFEMKKQLYSIAVRKEISELRKLFKKMEAPLQIECKNGFLLIEKI